MTPWGRRREHATASVARDRDDLLRLLVEGGCPVCRYRNDGLDAWLRAYAAESRTEIEVQRRMTASLGPCPAHTRYLLVDGSASWLLKSVYLDVVDAGLSRLARRDRSAIAECRLCAQERQEERLALGRLVRALAPRRGDHDTDLTKIRDAYRDAGGACLTHALDAVRLADAGTATLLVKTLRHRLGATGMTGTDLDAPLRSAVHDKLATESLTGDEEATRRSVLDRVRADLAAGCCPVCVSGQRAEWRFLRWATADVERRPEEVTLCQPHHADLAASGADAGTQAVLTSNLDGWRARLDRYDTEAAASPSRSRATAVARLVEPMTCRACEAATITMRRTGQLLDAAATDPALSTQVDAAHGVCLRHVLAGEPASDRFRELLIARLTLLRWSLEESLRKDRWTTRWEARGAELSAWTTAPALIDGRAYAGHAPSAVRPCLHRPAR